MITVIVETRIGSVRFKKEVKKRKRRQKSSKLGGIDEERRCSKKERVQKRRQKGTINIALKSRWNRIVE